MSSEQLQQIRRWLKQHMPYRLKALLAPFVPAIERSLIEDPAQGAGRDYKKIWIDPQGKAYRMQVYERQRQGGEKPLDSNPTVEEVKAALRNHSPNSVLEIGCGWGRLLSAISEEFNVEGCDVSEDMLRLCPPGVRAFYYDLAEPPGSFVQENMQRWDVLFTRGVMVYLMDTPQRTTYAMNNMLMLARKKILIWEWPEVCSWMQQFSDNAKFEYHPLEHREE